MKANLPAAPDGSVLRRDFMLALGAGLVAVPPRAFAQGKVHRIGYLSPGAAGSKLQEAFLEGMRALGYARGANLAVEQRFCGSRYELLPELAAELVRLNPDVIVAVTTPAAVAVQKATPALPAVAISVSDPVASGLARTLARPGGNITGMSDATSDLVPKLLEQLKAFRPTLSRVALLFNPTNPNHLAYARGLSPAASQIGVTLTRFPAGSVQDIERAFPLMAETRAEGLVVATDAFLYNQGSLIAKLALDHRLPSAFAYRQDALAGGLVSYGPSSLDLFRRAAGLVDKVLKGAKPAELPFEQPVLFDLVINLKTANALGLKPPQSLLASATELVE